jgi:hypothetical protein
VSQKYDVSFEINRVSFAPGAAKSSVSLPFVWRRRRFQLKVAREATFLTADSVTLQITRVADAN